MLQFDFETIKLATSNFSDANALGQGGFGTVYKVKKLSIFLLLIHTCICQHIFQKLYKLKVIYKLKVMINFRVHLMDMMLLSKGWLTLPSKEKQNSRMKFYLQGSFNIEI